MSHFMTQYLNRPWARGTRGPNTFDCWGLIHWVYKTHLGVDLPAYVIPSHIPGPTHAGKIHMEEQARGVWNPIDKPVDGCLVTLSCNTAVHHVGIYFEHSGGLVYHANSGATVHAMKFHRLLASGFTNVICYKYNGNDN